MQSFYPERFEREMGCTEAEWLMWLPRAVGAHPYIREAKSAVASISGGQLHLVWQVLEPRVLGLVRLPRMQVGFHFSGLTEEERFKFMKRFDLYTQRGGG